MRAFNSCLAVACLWQPHQMELSAFDHEGAWSCSFLLSAEPTNTSLLTHGKADLNLKSKVLCRVRDILHTLILEMGGTVVTLGLPVF